MVTGLDGKTYRPHRPKPDVPEPTIRTDAEQPTVAARFAQEMDILDHSIDRLAGLVAKASDDERAELARQWADVVVDRAARLSVIYRKVHD